MGTPPSPTLTANSSTSRRTVLGCGVRHATHIRSVASPPPPPTCSSIADLLRQTTHMAPAAAECRPGVARSGRTSLHPGADWWAISFSQNARDIIADVYSLLRGVLGLSIHDCILSGLKYTADTHSWVAVARIWLVGLSFTLSP